MSWDYFFMFAMVPLHLLFLILGYIACLSNFLFVSDVLHNVLLFVCCLFVLHVYFVVFASIVCHLSCAIFTPLFATLDCKLHKVVLKN